ncbi:MAG: hypothetical protein ACF8MF_12325 [Phycisphaerales bacterium JB052]
MRYKITIAVLAVFAVVGLAAYQVQRYYMSDRSDPNAKQTRGVVVKSQFVEYETEELRRSGNVLESALYQRVHEGLKELEPGHRPSDVQADHIAKAYSRFLILRRTATREEYLAEAKGEPINGLLSEDAALAEKAWKYNTSWARHADIPVESIRVTPVFLRGKAVGDASIRGKRSVRKLRNGKLFSEDTVGGYSVYQVFIDMTVPTVDAADDLDVTVRTMMINDGPNGEWMPAAVEFIGVPEGKFCFVPSP